MPKRGSKRRSSQEGDIQVGKPTAAWMLTYSDLMTQILIFFVLFMTLMTVRERRIEGMILPLVGSTGTISSQRKSEQVIPPIINEPQMLKMKEQLLIYTKSKGLADEVRLRLGERGLTISFAEKAMFNVAKAQLLPDAEGYLDDISKILKVIPNNVRIEGHTCDLPISTKEFPSNWELSAVRATNVTRYMVEKAGFSPARISAAGYGQYHPYAPNDTEENRRLNRRVDIVILWQKAQRLE